MPSPQQRHWTIAAAISGTVAGFAIPLSNYFHGLPTHCLCMYTGLVAAIIGCGATWKSVSQRRWGDLVWVSFALLLAQQGMRFLIVHLFELFHFGTASFLYTF